MSASCRRARSCSASEAPGCSRMSRTVETCRSTDAPLGQRRKVDEEHAVGRLADGSAGRLEGQPRLPDATHAAERQEAARPQEPIDVGELALATDEAGDGGGKVVAFLRRSGRRDLMTQDRLFEALQLLTGLEAELFVEDPACASVGRERIGLAFRSIQGEHQLPPQPFAVRVLADQAFQLVDQLGILAERQVGLDSILERRQPKVLQALGLQSQGPFVAQPLRRDGPSRAPGPGARRVAARRVAPRSSASCPSLASRSKRFASTASPPDVERVARGAARDRGIGTQHAHGAWRRRRGSSSGRRRAALRATARRRADRAEPAAEHRRAGVRAARAGAAPRGQPRLRPGPPRRGRAPETRSCEGTAEAGCGRHGTMVGVVRAPDAIP